MSDYPPKTNNSVDLPLPMKLFLLCLVVYILGVLGIAHRELARLDRRSAASEAAYRALQAKPPAKQKIEVEEEAIIATNLD